METPIIVLLSRLEHHYAFECEGGPLANCQEWIVLKETLQTNAALMEADARRLELQRLSRMLETFAMTSTTIHRTEREDMRAAARLLGKRAGA